MWTLSLPCAPRVRDDLARGYCRATELARLPGVQEAIGERSPYLGEILHLCLRGAWYRELRQFMPPASLRSSVETLVALGLIDVR